MAPLTKVAEVMKAAEVAALSRIWSVLGRAPFHTPGTLLWGRAVGVARFSAMSHAG
jgi:hypothetical protein